MTTSGPRSRARWGPPARAAVTSAEGQARRRGDPYATDGHVLLGLLDADQGLAITALSALGVPLEGLRSRVGDLITEPAAGPTAPGRAVDDEEPSWLPTDLDQVLARTEREARRRGHEELGTEHLLLGLLAIPAGATALALARLGVDPRLVRAQVAAERLAADPAGEWREAGPGTGWPAVAWRVDHTSTGDPTLAGDPRVQAVVDAAAAALLAEEPVVGLALAVGVGGEPVAFLGRGFADVDTGAPVGPDTVFRLASVTKPFVAALVLRLWEQGRLGLDDHVGPWPVTVRQALSHLAGFAQGSGLRHHGPGPLPTRPELNRGEVPLDGPPGERWRYSNWGFAVLGQVVEDITRTPLADALAEHVLEPLGLGTVTFDRATGAPDRLATAHVVDRGQVVPVAWWESLVPAATGLLATPVDLVRFATALVPPPARRHSRLLRRRTVEFLRAPKSVTTVAGRQQALGLWVEQEKGRSLVGHTGDVPGWKAAVWIAPDDDVAVVALANCEATLVDWTCRDVLRRLLSES